MSKERIMLGASGEDMAVSMLEATGCCIIERNFRCRAGEIDIIAEDGEYLCFIEVKTRANTGFMHPAQAVSPAKIRAIRRVAEYYLLTHGFAENMYAPYVRFDVIEALGGDFGDTYENYEINHIKDAF